MTNLEASSIKLYPMAQDVNGTRSHQQYVDQMASYVLALYFDYRMEWDDIEKLVLYAKQNQHRLV